MKRLCIVLFMFIGCFIGSYAQKPLFNHLAICVTDLKKSTSFYKDVIGLDTIANPFNDKKHVWFSIGGSNELHIIAGAAPAAAHPQDNHLCFRVSSVEDFIQRLRKAGVSYENARGKKDEITVRPDGVKQIYFTDPDGYWIEVNDVQK